jgi:hypothetical protein
MMTTKASVVGSSRRATALAPEDPGEVSPPPPNEPEVVPPPPPEEVPLPLPEEASAPQPVEVVSIPALTADEATWSVNLFCEVFNKLRQVAVHLGVPAPMIRYRGP